MSGGARRQHRRRLGLVAGALVFTAVDRCGNGSEPVGVSAVRSEHVVLARERRLLLTHEAEARGLDLRGEHLTAGARVVKDERDVVTKRARQNSASWGRLPPAPAPGRG